MKVRLLRDQRIKHAAGEIVEVSPAVYDFLVTTNTAVPVTEEKEPPKKTRKASK